MRTKLSLIDSSHLVPNWKEYIKRALPFAEKYNVVMLPEIHSPNKLKGDVFVDEICEFIDKEQTKHFGLNIDFGVFMDVKEGSYGWFPGEEFVQSKPEDIIPLLPYTHCCHAKFFEMDDNFDEPNIPYETVVDIMKRFKWDGYLLSEYEGMNKDVPGYSTAQVRRHHVMLKQLLGE